MSEPEPRVCICGRNEPLTGKQALYASNACKARVWKARTLNGAQKRFPEALVHGAELLTPAEELLCVQFRDAMAARNPNRKRLWIRDR